MDICDLCQAHGRCLSKVNLFKDLGIDESKSIYLSAVHKDFDRGESIFSINDPIDDVIVVRYGKIKASNYDSNGKEIISKIYVPGDVIGDDSIFLEETYETNGLALEKTGICILNKDNLRNILASDLDFSINMIKNLSQKLHDSEKLLEILSIKDSYKRLAAFLLYRSKMSSSDTISLNQEDIASSINTTRETVSRKLSQLEKEGLIEIIAYKKIRIKNTQDLKNLINS